jgi:carboxylesterase type B
MIIGESRVIETSKGKVGGKKFVFEDGNSASAYLGIPYAKPPIGELRFKVGLVIIEQIIKLIKNSLF